MASKKVFGDNTKSKLDNLYNSEEDIVGKNATTLIYNVPITFRRIIDTLKNQPFLTITKKSPLLDFDAIDVPHLDLVAQNIFSTAKGIETAVIEMMLVENIGRVKFMHAGMISVGNKKKFAPPRFVIDLSAEKIGARCGVRINTGYVVKINTVSMGKKISDGKIVNTEVGPQPDFILIPQIISKHVGLVQCLYGRDPEDTGLLTINFTTTEDLDVSKPMQVVLHAFAINASVGVSSIVENESTSALFKAKDNRSGRSVKNPKTKFLANDFDTTSAPKSLLLKTFSSTGVFEKQKIKIDNTIAFFTSRKREWADANLITMAGVFNPTTGVHFPATIVDRAKMQHNVHGIVFIKNKITIISVDTPFDYDCRIINGSFHSLPSYAEINRDIRKVNRAIHNLSIGAKICKSISNANANFNFQDLIRVFDYARSISADDSRLQDKVLLTDEKLFAGRPADLNCYSVLLYNGLRSLAYLCCRDLFTEDQVKDMSLTCSKASDDGAKTLAKRPLEDEDAAAGEKRAKLV